MGGVYMPEWRPRVVCCFLCVCWDVGRYAESQAKLEGVVDELQQRIVARETTKRTKAKIDWVNMHDSDSETDVKDSWLTESNVESAYNHSDDNLPSPFVGKSTTGTRQPTQQTNQQPHRPKRPKGTGLRASGPWGFRALGLQGPKGLHGLGASQPWGFTVLGLQGFGVPGPWGLQGFRASRALGLPGSWGFQGLGDLGASRALGH